MSLTNKLCAIGCFILTPIIYPTFKYTHKYTDGININLREYWETLKFGWSMED